MISCLIPPLLSGPGSQLAIAEGHVTAASALVGLAAAGVIWMIGSGLTKRALADTASNFEALVVSGAVALALVIGLGLILHGIGHLNATGWLVSIGVLAILTFPYLGGSIALFTGILCRRPHMNGRDALMLASAVVLSVVAIQEARNGAFSHREFAFTELWLLRDGDKASDQFVLGFTNHERVTAMYGLDILVDGRLVNVWDGIEVEPGKSWITALSLPGAARPSRRVEGLLYKNGDRETAYRRVWVESGA